MTATPSAEPRRRLGTSASRSGAALVGNCAYALAQFGVLVVLARQTKISDVGDYALALAVTAPIQLGLGLRLRTIRAVEMGPTPLRTYLQLATVLGASAVLLATAVGTLIAPNPRFVLVVALVALAKSVEGFIEVCYGEYQRQDRLTAIAVSQLIRAVLTITLVMLGAHVAGLIGALAAMVIAWLGQLVPLRSRVMRQVARAAELPGDPASMGSLVRRSWPLGLASAISSLSVSLPRFTVAGLLDSTALGLLAILSYPTTVISLFANSLGQANVREMTSAATSRNYRQLRSQLLAMMAATTALGAIGACLTLVAGGRGITWLLGPGYAENISLLLLLIVAATLAGFTTNTYYLLVSTGRFGLQPVIVCISLGLAIPAVYLATSHYGLMGTAVALAFMYAMQALLTGSSAAIQLRRQPPSSNQTLQAEEAT